MTSQHWAIASLAEFLNREPRQVWAVRRDSGEPFFLPEGQAEALRKFTKDSLRCPHPECTVSISTRGGSKRDHFFHVKRPAHETGRESEFHLAGKAMLFQWASTRVPEGAVVKEETTVKDPATRLLRRADVMVTGQSGRRVAFEVEYKSFAVEHWRRKQADYNQEKVACAWLLGHTRVRMATSPASLAGLGVNAVKVPQLGAEIARSGHPLLVINPATREVGTLAADPSSTSLFQGDGLVAWLSVDPLGECEFEPRRGVVTPTMRRLEAEEEVRRRAALEAPSVLLEPADRLSHRHASWESSPLRPIFWRRWGGIPVELGRSSVGTEEILAAPVHWHGAIYEELLHGKGPSDDFKWRDVFAALDKHRIGRRSDQKAVYAALGGYLEDLQRLGLVKIYRDRQKRVLLFSPSTLDIGEVAEPVARADGRFLP